MTHEMLFWILMLFWFLTNGYLYWPRPVGTAPTGQPIALGGSWLLVFVIVAMLGWYGKMGPAIH